MSKNNMVFEGHIRFKDGFDAAQKAYESLSWWERMLGVRLGNTFDHDYDPERCCVEYRS